MSGVCNSLADLHGSPLPAKKIATFLFKTERMIYGGRDPSWTRLTGREASAPADQTTTRPRRRPSDRDGRIDRPDSARRRPSSPVVAPTDSQ